MQDMWQITKNLQGRYVKDIEALVNIDCKGTLVYDSDSGRYYVLDCNNYLFDIKKNILSKAIGREIEIKASFIIEE